VLVLVNPLNMPFCIFVTVLQDRQLLKTLFGLLDFSAVVNVSSPVSFVIPDRLSQQVLL